MKWVELLLIILHAIALTAEASPRAAVIVAVAVDEMLQSKSPALPDTLAKAAPEATPQEVQVTLWTIPNCGPCDAQKRVMDGMPGVKLRVVVDYTAKFQAYPVLTADGREPLRGLHTRQQVEAWLRGVK